jgi:hypothetical protein
MEVGAGQPAGPDADIHAAECCLRCQDREPGMARPRLGSHRGKPHWPQEAELLVKEPSLIPVANRGTPLLAEDAVDAREAVSPWCHT